LGFGLFVSRFIGISVKSHILQKCFLLPAALTGIIIAQQVAERMLILNSPAWENRREKETKKGKVKAETIEQSKPTSEMF
jgi:hypothetical protein